MSGIRQHIFPRFLLKGFSSRQKVSSEIYTWVYRKGKKPYECNIKNVGVERNFYGKEGEEGEADTCLTEIEKGHAPLLDKLRKNKGYAPFTDQRIGELISSFVTRSKHIRESFKESTDLFINELDTWFSSEQNIRVMIQKQPAIFQKALDNALNQHPFPLTLEQRALGTLYAKQMLPRFIEQNMNVIQGHFRALIKEAYRTFPGMIKASHNMAISGDPLPERRAEKYNSLEWSVCPSLDFVILGDSACVFEIAQGSERRFKFIDDIDDDIYRLYLPISSSSVILGTRKGRRVKPDMRSANRASAELSREFIVTSHESKKAEQLCDVIGTKSNIFTQDELEDLVSKALQNNLPFSLAPTRQALRKSVNSSS